MDRCERCGRHPAKWMSFNAHQGFLIFRRQYTLAGVFCRDCALECYAAARGITLRGMWFSPDALVLGTLGSLWDSAKLLDLPPEVKDGVWVWHRVACPKCQQATVCGAGETKCGSCHARFVIVSCSCCGTVHSRLTSTPWDSVTITCRACGKKSQAPGPGRHGAPMLIPRALAEIAANIGASPADLGKWRSAVAPHSPLQPHSWDWIFEYYMKCCKEASQQEIRGPKNRERSGVGYVISEPIGEVLQRSLEVREFEFLVAAFTICRSLCADEQFARLCGLVTHFGLDPDELFSSRSGEDDLSEQPIEWASVLGVSESSTLAEVQRAYQALAKQFHPDLWHDACPDDRNRNADRMKELNAAYAAAKVELSAVQVQEGTSSNRETKQEPPAGPRCQASDGAPTTGTQSAREDVASVQQEASPFVTQGADTDKCTNRTTNEETADVRPHTSRISKQEMRWLYPVGLAALAGLILWIYVNIPRPHGPPETEQSSANLYSGSPGKKAQAPGPNTKKDPAVPLEPIPFASDPTPQTPSAITASSESGQFWPQGLIGKWLNEAGQREYEFRSDQTFVGREADGSTFDGTWQLNERTLTVWRTGNNGKNGTSYPISRYDNNLITLTDLDGRAVPLLRVREQ